MRHLKTYKLFEEEEAVRKEWLPEYVYHVTPVQNERAILNNGIKPATGGRTHLQRTYDPRIYLATSLIGAYDLQVGFNAHDGEDYIIFKLRTEDIPSTTFYDDEKFLHGVWTPDAIPASAIITSIDPSDLQYDEDDLEDIYNYSWHDYIEAKPIRGGEVITNESVRNLPLELDYEPDRKLVQGLVKNARKWKLDDFKEEYVYLLGASVLDDTNKLAREGDTLTLGYAVKDDDGKSVYRNGIAVYSPKKEIVLDKDYGTNYWSVILDHTQELQDEAEKAWWANKNRKKPELPEGAKTVRAYHSSPDKFRKFEYQDHKTSGQFGADTGFFFFMDKKNADYYASVLKDNHGQAYLYTCTINVGNQLELNGEDIGTSFGRQSELAHAAYDHDTVLIKDADTGYGITDELVVFDDDNIRIDEIDTV